MFNSALDSFRIFSVLMSSFGIVKGSLVLEVDSFGISWDC